MDFIIGLPLSKRAGIIYNSILIIVDRFIKSVCYLATIKIIIVEELGELFFLEIIYRFSIPAGVISNRGIIFTNAF
jgi:hypothetical protein